MAREIVEANRLALYFQSGIAAVKIPVEGDMKVESVSQNVRGTFTKITF